MSPALTQIQRAAHHAVLCQASALLSLASALGDARQVVMPKGTQEAPVWIEAPAETIVAHAAAILRPELTGRGHSARFLCPAVVSSTYRR